MVWEYWTHVGKSSNHMFQQDFPLFIGSIFFKMHVLYIKFCMVYLGSPAKIEFENEPPKKEPTEQKLWYKAPLDPKCPWKIKVLHPQQYRWTNPKKWRKRGFPWHVVFLKIIGTASMLFFWGAHCEKMSNPWCDLMIQTSQMGTPEGFMALDSRRISPNREITQTGKHQTLLPTHDTVTSWSFQPIWKICSSKWESSPIFGVNIKKWNHHPANDTVINHCLIEFEPKQDQTGPNNQPMGSMVVNACLYGKEMDFPIPDLCQRQLCGKNHEISCPSNDQLSYWSNSWTSTTHAI